MLGMWILLGSHDAANADAYADDRTAQRMLMRSSIATSELWLTASHDDYRSEDPHVMPSHAGHAILPEISSAAEWQ